MEYTVQWLWRISLGTIAAKFKLHIGHVSGCWFADESRVKSSLKSEQGTVRLELMKGAAV